MGDMTSIAEKGISPQPPRVEGTISPKSLLPLTPEQKTQFAEAIIEGQKHAALMKKVDQAAEAMQKEQPATPSKPKEAQPTLTPQKAEQIAVAAAGVIAGAGPGVASVGEVLKAAQNQPPAIVQHIGEYDINKLFKFEVPATSTPFGGPEKREQQIQVQPATEVYSLTLSPDQNKEVLTELGQYGKEIAAKEGDPSIRVFRVPVNYDRSTIKNLTDYHLPLMVDPKTGQPYTTELTYFLGGIPGQFTQGGLIDAVYTGQPLPDGKMKWSVLFQVKDDNKVWNMKAGALIFMDSTTKVTDPNKPVNIVNVDNNVEGLTLTTTIATPYFINVAKWANPEVFKDIKPGDELVVYVDKDNNIHRLVSGTPETQIKILEFREGIQAPVDAGTQESTTVNGEAIPLAVTAVPSNPDHSNYLLSGGNTLSKYQTTPEALAAAGTARILTPKELGSEFVSGIEVTFADGRKFTIKTNLMGFDYTDQVKVALLHEELQKLGILDLHKKNFEILLVDAKDRSTGKYGRASNWSIDSDGKDKWEGYGYVDKVTDKGDKMQYVVYVDKRSVETSKIHPKVPDDLQILGNMQIFYAIVFHQTGGMGMMSKVDEVVHSLDQFPFKVEPK